jgi:hypothetical protein
MRWKSASAAFGALSEFRIITIGGYVAADGGDESVAINGIGEELDRTTLFCSCHVLGSAGGGSVENHRNLGCCRIFLELGAQVESTDVGQADVEYGHCRRFVFGELQSFCAVASPNHAESRRGQKARDRVVQDRIIVNKKDFGGHDGMLIDSRRFVAVVMLKADSSRRKTNAQKSKPREQSRGFLRIQEEATR